MSDYLILNALCIDGSGSPPFKANLLIEGDSIAYIGSQIRTARQTIDATGLILSPGFIDTHSHSEFSLAADGRAQGKVAQGVTTEVNGNCGLSAAPIYGDVSRQREPDFVEYSIQQRWQDLEEYYSLLTKKGIAINFATLCGHGNIRASVMGYVRGRANDEQMKAMLSYLSECINMGAKGLSVGLIYPPGVFTDTEELIELCKGLKQLRPDALYVPHMRSETDHLLEAVEESIRIAEGSGLRLHISHLKTGGRANWHKIDKVIELIEEARARGLKVTCDRYPYTASSTDLDTVLAKWVYEGGIEEELKRLQNPDTQALIREQLSLEPQQLWEEILISCTYLPKNKWMEGKSIAQVAETLSMKPADLVIELLIADRAKTGAIFFSMNEENLKRFLRLPYMMIGSDSAVRCFDGVTKKGMPHPRGFGSFPRFIGRYVRDEGLMPLQEAIRRCTSLPAETFGLEKRGLLREGYFADLVVFDYDRIIDRSDYLNPYERPEGIRWVFVNGVPVYEDGKFTDRLPGRII